ncbi:IS630 family transposase [Methylocystis sp. IM3]|uniref:IS630 family transposase n=1 Tax=unclassified Methylocystis TaxID=2625913 RepID=UPI00311A6A1B
MSYRRPRHTLKGRQDADAIARVGLRLALRKAQAKAGDIVLLHADESEALTHPYLARAWAKRGVDLRVPAPGQSKKIAMLGARDAVSGELLVVARKTKRSTDFILLLEEIDRVYGPSPGAMRKPVVIVLDNGPIHVSKATKRALEARAHWLTVEWLPKYAPELNEIERSWRDLKSHHLAHQTFANEAELENAIHKAVADMNDERATQPLDDFRISAQAREPLSCDQLQKMQA